jgi:hypothetical protein
MSKEKYAPYAGGGHFVTGIPASPRALPMVGAKILSKRPTGA